MNARHSKNTIDERICIVLSFSGIFGVWFIPTICIKWGDGNYADAMFQAFLYLTVIIFSIAVSKFK
jgi:hypothetical protein